MVAALGRLTTGKGTAQHRKAAAAHPDGAAAVIGSAGGAHITADDGAGLGFGAVCNRQAAIYQEGAAAGSGQGIAVQIQLQVGIGGDLHLTGQRHIGGQNDLGIFTDPSLGKQIRGGQCPLRKSHRAEGQGQCRRQNKA